MYRDYLFSFSRFVNLDECGLILDTLKNAFVKVPLIVIQEACDQYLFINDISAMDNNK